MTFPAYCVPYKMAENLPNVSIHRDVNILSFVLLFLTYDKEVHCLANNKTTANSFFLVLNPFVRKAKQFGQTCLH